MTASESPRTGRHRGDAALLASLAGGDSIKTAAAAAKLSEATVYRRLRDPAFKQQLATMQDALTSEALGVLTKGATHAAAVLRALLRESEPPAVRLGAARAILTQVREWREADELEQRLAALEARLGEQAAGMRGQP